MVDINLHTTKTPTKHQTTTDMTRCTHSLVLLGSTVGGAHNSLVDLTRVHQTFIPLRIIRDFPGTNLAHSMGFSLVHRDTTSSQLIQDKEIITAEIFNRTIPMRGIPTCEILIEEILSWETL